jgi:ATP-binding cassette subfamily B protein
MQPRRLRDRRREQLLSPRSRLTQLRHVPRALKLVWAAAAGWTIAYIALLVAQGLLPVATVYLTRWLVNALVAVLQSGADRAHLVPALLSAVLMGLVLLAGEALASVADYVQTALAEQTQDRMNGLIHAKAVSLDLRFFESPDYYDQLQRTSIDAIDRPLALLRSLGGLAQNTVTLLAMGSVLLGFAWWMPLALLIGTVPALWVALRTAWQFHRWRLNNTLNQRRLTYYQRVVILDQAAAELRLFDLGGHFIFAYRTLRRQLRSERLQLARQQMLAQLGAGLLGLLSVLLSLLWMGWQALRGLFGLGDLAMFYQAMNQGQLLMRGLLTGVGGFTAFLLTPLSRPPAWLPNWCLSRKMSRLPYVRTGCVQWQTRWFFQQALYWGKISSGLCRMVCMMNCVKYIPLTIPCCYSSV